MTRQTCLILPTLILAGLAPSAWAVCSIADMKGDFATQPVGFVTGGPFAGQFAATGVIHFDGAGKFTGVTSSSFNGALLYPFAAVGTYAVTSDCAVTVLETTLGISFEGYISATKNEVVLVEPDPGTITINLLRRIQIPSGCSNANLNGNWTFQAAGINIVTGERISQNGRIKLDGKGNFSGVTAFSNEGDFRRSTIAGTVQVAADCTFLLKYTDQAGITTPLFGTFFGSGAQFILIYSKEGVVIIGNGRQAVN